VSNSTQSQPHDALPHETLGSQLAAALDLLHKKSEEISELRAQVVMLRMRSTDGEAKLHKQVGNGALKSMQEVDYLATGIQTDRDDEAHAVWNLERTRWAKEKLALQGEAEALRGEKARVLADVDFFREQYQRASAFASSTRSENEELSARAALAESQAVNGVALVRATLEARVAKLEAEVQKYKALSEMLTERARRTDDNVRYRAARALELERDYTKLSGQFRETEAELEETWDELRAKKRVNIKLRRRIASLESKEGAADVGQSGEQKRILSSEQKDDDDDYRPSRSPSSSPVTVGSSPQRHSPHNEDGAGPADRPIEQLASIGPGESVQSNKEDMVYLCRWRPGEPASDCDVVVTSKQV
jgi:chromosome segregation ATPase